MEWERGEMCMEMEGEGGMRRERVDRIGVLLESLWSRVHERDYGGERGN